MQNCAFMNYYECYYLECYSFRLNSLNLWHLYYVLYVLIKAKLVLLCGVDFDIYFALDEYRFI